MFLKHYFKNSVYLENVYNDRMMFMVEFTHFEKRIYLVIKVYKLPPMMVKCQNFLDFFLFIFGPSDVIL